MVVIYFSQCFLNPSSNLFVFVGNCEASFKHAINSAGTTHAITQACSRGNLTNCSCDRSKETGLTEEGWRWGGCSADIEYGLRFSRIFVDAGETVNDARSLMNLHNNEVGRQVGLVSNLIRPDTSINSLARYTLHSALSNLYCTKIMRKKDHNASSILKTLRVSSVSL